MQVAIYFKKRFAICGLLYTLKTFYYMLHFILKKKKKKKKNVHDIIVIKLSFLHNIKSHYPNMNQSDVR